MGLRFFSNMVSQASRGIATGVFVIGLLLIGFGAVIIAFPEIFAFLAAVVFFVAGLSLIITAGKIFLVHRHFSKAMRTSDSQDYRKNVRLHIEDRNDL